MHAGEAVLPLMFLGLFYIALTGVEAFLSHRRAGLMIKLHERILDKFADASEFAELIGTDSGQRYLKTLTFEPLRPHGRVMRSMQAGIVLLCLGLGLALVDRFFPDAERALLLAGSITLSLGAGFLLAAWVSHRLSRSWGLYSGDAAKGLDA